MFKDPSTPALLRLAPDVSQRFVRRMETNPDRDKINVLDRLQEAAGLSRAAVERWERCVRSERRAAARKREVRDASDLPEASLGDQGVGPLRRRSASSGIEDSGTTSMWSSSG